MLSLSLLFLSTIFYLFFQSIGIYGGDAGDLVTAAYLTGVAHPPGFPLYTILGHLLTKLPLFTVAWRVSLVSSLPAAVTLYLIYRLISDLTKNKIIALVSSMTLGLTYLFWLYAIVPEVFMLHVMFETTLIYCCWQLHKTKSLRFLYWLAFFFGLSLTHHPIIVFLTPALAYWLMVNRQLWVNQSKFFFLKLMGLFAMGLTPYLYIFWAAARNPAINWNRVHNIYSFVKLITRADYGTFQSGPLYGQTILSRLVQLPVILEFVHLDFTLIGLILAVAGVVYLFKKTRQWAWFLLIGFLSVGPVYFFYASYTLGGAFSLATLERFLLPSYIFITLFLAGGMQTLVSVIAAIPKKIVRPHIKQLLLTIIMLSVFFIPLLLLFNNYYRLLPLKNDLTMENYANDILSTVPKKSLLILQRDNALFNVQYVYYTQKKWPGVVLIHDYRLFKGELYDYLKKNYSTLAVSNGVGSDLVSNFITDNYDQWPIYSNSSIPVQEKGGWVRYGLLLRFYKQKDLPPVKKLLADNDRLWQSYHHPLQGALGVYKNLMPANVLDFYAEAGRETAQLYLGDSKVDKAETFLKEAIKLVPDNAEDYYYLAQVQLKKNQCRPARDSLKKALSLDKHNLTYMSLLRDSFRHCFKDESSATSWQKQIDAEKQKSAIPLKQL